MILKDGERLELLDINAVIQLGDIHFGLKSSNDNSIKYLEWMENMKSYFTDFFIPLVEKYKVRGYKPVIFIDGDFFDNRKTLRVDVINCAIDIVSILSKMCKIVFCIGNHDTYFTDNNRVNSLRVFENMDNVYIVERTAWVKTAFATFDIISWIENGAEESKLVKDSTADYLILHTDINGLKYPSNVKIEGRVEAKGFKGKHIYSGHIHKRQEKGKVTYVGSPYEIDKSDAGNVKGVYILRADFIDDETGFDIMEDFVENDYSPRFVSYNVKELQEMKDSGKDIEKVLANNYVSVRYESADAPKYKDIMNSLEGYGRGIEFSEIRDDVKVEDLDSEEIKSLSIDDAVYECISQLDLKDEEKEFLTNKHKEYSKLTN